MKMSIKIFAVDVDGTLTDGIYNVDEDGKISKNFYTRDFDALRQLAEAGIDIVILTSSNDSVIFQKCKSLSFCVDVYVGIIHKKAKMDEILQSHPDTSWDNVACIGDAENDIECIKASGFSGCPSDAIEELKKTVLVNKNNYGILVNQYRYVDFLSKNPGGRGAVYDFAMEVLKRNNKGE
jgi:3-deoxy-D-manno-octulosonate 8-phosphate phosphatase (KDO 8-P phosphatase)